MSIRLLLSETLVMQQLLYYCQRRVFYEPLALVGVPHAELMLDQGIRDALELLG